jgi:molecular chaperone GrpE
VSQRKRSAERREGAPDEPARPASGEDGRPPAGPKAPLASGTADGQGPTEGAPPLEDVPEGEVPIVDPPDEAEGAEGEPEATAAGGPEAPEAERDEYLALAQRTKADFENYRKRATRELAAAGVRGKAALARELLPVVDNLERALESADEAEAGLADGVRLVLSELIAALERNGVSPIQPLGEAFDPNLHEALSTRAENGAEAGVVLDVVQKGYRLEGTVLRPARVVVSA